MVGTAGRLVVMVVAVVLICASTLFTLVISSSVTPRRTAWSLPEWRSG
ncbi:MAG: hypothetical protein WCB85_02970 [Candidatus Dormiibacterota bacterium]